MFKNIICGVWGGMLLLLTACNRKAANATLPPIPAVVDASRLEEANKAAHRQQELTDSLAQPHLMFLLKRTGCYGTCPVFEAKVYSNGRATYDGIRHVQRIGLFEALVDSNWIQIMLDSALSIQYLSFEDQYPIGSESIPDLPTTTTKVFWNNQEKTVENNFGSPKSLRNFEDFLESELEKLQWVKREH